MKLLAAIDVLLLGVLRLARAVLGLALFGGAMLLALVLVLGVLVWALLRGRRPVAVRAVWRRAAARQPFGGARPAADVVDVEAREVPATSRVRSGQGG